MRAYKCKCVINGGRRSGVEGVYSSGIETISVPCIGEYPETYNIYNYNSLSRNTNNN